MWKIINLELIPNPNGNSDHIKQILKSFKMLINFGYWGDNIITFSVLLVLMLIIVMKIFGLKKVPLAYNLTMTKLLK
jgi:hypothetical protein